MLSANTNKGKNTWANGTPVGHATYVPSALLLLMAIDNGWEIVKVQPVASWENYGPVYLMTVRCNSGGGDQKLVIPRSALVDTIINQYASAHAIVQVCQDHRYLLPQMR